MQAPGGPEEDTSGDFKFGGWTAPYVDANGNDFFERNMQPAEYLLGRKTFDIFAGYWPFRANSTK
jgi:dihydrofolate reductase